MLRLLTTTALLLGFSAPLLAQVCPPHLPPPVAPDSRYSVAEPVSGQFVVTDLETGLMWKQCPEGLSGAGCASGSLSALNWSAALAAANASSHAGHSDWRLPSAMELHSLVETSCRAPAINTRLFPRNGTGVYWTSTTRAPVTSNSWGVGFSDGYLGTRNKSNNNVQVRLVRGGPGLDPFDAAGDFTPDAYSFTAQTDVPLYDLRVSNAIIVTGIDTPVGIGVSGDASSAYSVNGGAFTSTPGAVVDGDSVVVRHVSAATPFTAVTSTLQIGALTADFVSTTMPPTYTIGGEVSGLSGAGLVLRNNDADDLEVSSSGSFTFSTALPDGSPYLVTVHTQPVDPNQTCVVANEAGNLAGANVTDVEVNCTTDTYTVTTTATNGTITSTIDPVIEHGQTTTVTGQASDNHYFASVSGCNGIPQGNSDQSVTDFSYETGPIVEDCTIEAVFAIRTYPVTATNSGNGSITPSFQTVDHGSSAGFIVTPAANHHVVSVLGDNCTPEDQGGGTWIATNITQACAVTATFAINTYTVTTTATNGTITSTENPVIDHGETTTVTGEADENHYFASVSGCGGTEQTNTDQSVTDFTYETGPITEACTVEAVFAIRTYTVTSMATNGTITSTENPMIDHGQTTTVTGDADENHYFASVSGCDGTPQTNTDQSVTDFSYETGPITEACTVEAVFAIRTYTVTTTAINGTITSTENPVVDHGQTTTVTGDADENHYFASVFGCDGIEQTNTDQSVTDFSYETGPITEACTVEAVFATLTYTVSVAEIQGEGTVDVLTPVVDHDDDAEFEVTPDAGWSLASFSGDTCTPADNGDGTWTASNITADCAVTAVFVDNTTTGIRVSRHPAIINEAVTYTITVTGTATAPPDGQVDLVSDTDGSICSLTTADSTSSNTATFTCQHTWNEPGSHELTAMFSGSGTHGDSSDQMIQQIVSDEFIFHDRFESDP